MPEVDMSPSPGFLDRLSQRLRGQRPTISPMKSQDVHLEDEKRPKKKKSFLDRFITPGSQVDDMRKNAKMLQDVLEAQRKK